MRIFDGLAMAVNLKIMQLQRRHPDTVFETIELHKDAWADLIAYRMDSILYPSSEKEESLAFWLKRLHTLPLRLVVLNVLG
jgi:hypothetical protein